ncbi:neurogenic locus notch-like protein [Trema orientale]|uniref:Neurogenic locus notch-like protein n=1 Tax=Trema orientale TaxID=63057 RepID=A0A2P5FWE3_TREOI|nr:neurogenic locus notch-like protein [Trema orientale]
MASTATFLCASLLVFLLLQPAAPSSVGELLSPLLSPVFDDVCKEVECGKGTCKPSSDSALFFECECQPGWKQTASGQADNLKFLPCVIPNCTLNYTCSKAPAPVQDKATKLNESMFDPCHWSQCGGGSCNTTSKFTYTCECPAGYYNLLNVSSFPCFQSCEIGMDCTNLGISPSNQSSLSTPSAAEKGNNHASSITQGHFLWLIITMMFIAMVL